MTPQVRQSNLELLRIFCMLMIIGGHVIMVHRTVSNTQSLDFVMSLFLQGTFAVAVNVFILISGYYGIKFKWQKLLKIEIRTWFYSVFLLGISCLLGWHSLNFKDDFLLFFPILSKQYWFVTCYVILFLISPLLNQWAMSWDKKKYERILITGFLLIYLWPTMSFLFNAAQFIDDAGYGIVNFIYLYMLGEYLHYYSDGKGSILKYWIGFVGSTLLLFLLQYGLSYILGFEFSSWMSYNTVFVFGGALCLFLAFRNMQFFSAFVNVCAKPCLAVYLIHLHPRIWYDFCEMIDVASFHGWRYLLLIIFLPILIYVTCGFVDCIRNLSLGWGEDGLVL